MVCFIFMYFSISKSFMSMIQTMAFQAKLLSRCIFKVIQYGYETFQTVLRLKYKIM